jgi:hypothetical protein
LEILFFFVLIQFSWEAVDIGWSFLEDGLVSAKNFMDHFLLPGRILFLGYILQG